MGSHLGIGAIDSRIVAIGVGHGSLEIIADHELRHAAEIPEQTCVHANPVGKALARAGFGVCIVRGPHRRDEQLHGVGFAGDRIENVDGVAGEIDEDLLPTDVGLAHARARTLLPGLKGRAKPGIAKAVGIGGAILLPQQQACYAAAAQRDVGEPDPVRVQWRRSSARSGLGRSGTRGGCRSSASGQAVP